MKFKIGKTLLFVVLLFGCGLGIRAGLSLIQRHGEARFEPALIELVDEPISGAILEIPLRFINETTKPVKLMSIRRSCSCTSIVTTGNRRVEENLVVDPDKSVPMKLTINTTNRYGDQHFFVEANIQQDGRVESFHSEVRVKVRGGWKAEPSEFLLTDLRIGEEFSRRFSLSDGMPDPGLTIKEIRSSHPEKFKARWILSKGPSSASSNGFRKRYDIEVFGPGLLEQGEVFRGQLTFLSKDLPPVELTVPVHGKSEPPSYEVLPTQLYVKIPPNSNETISRKILVRSHMGNEQSIRVLRYPEFLTIKQQVEKKGLMILEVAFQRSLAAGDLLTGEIEVGVSDTDPHRVGIPFKFIGIAD